MPTSSETNKATWEDIVHFTQELPPTEHWNKWRACVVPLLESARAAGYNELFRAGPSMHDIVVSTRNPYGPQMEPRVTLKVTEDGKVDIHYSTCNIWFGKSLNHEACDPDKAFFVLTRYLQHLWTDTMDEPIPEILRKPSK